MELAHALAIAKLRSSIAQDRSEERTLRTLVTSSESENVKTLAKLDLVKIEERIATSLEEIKKFEAE